MDNLTLDQQIKEKKKSMNADLYQASEKESKDMIKILERDDFYNNLNKDDTGKFSKESVVGAAKYMLKAKPFDIEVEEANIVDSPIYYKKNGTARWEINKKKLRKKARKLIEKVQTQYQREKAIEESKNKTISEAEEEIKIEKNISEFDEAAYQQSEQNITDVKESAAAASIDMLGENGNLFSSMDETMKDADKDTSLLNAKEADDIEMLKNTADEIDNIISEDLPTPAELKKRIRDIVTAGLRADMRKKLDKNIWSMGMLKGAVSKANEKGEELIKKFDGLYKKMQDGELSPEALKIWLNHSVLSNFTKSERKIYNSIINRKDKYAVKDEEKDAYNKNMLELAFALDVQSNEKEKSTDKKENQKQQADQNQQVDQEQKADQKQQEKKDEKKEVQLQKIHRLWLQINSAPRSYESRLTDEDRREAKDDRKEMLRRVLKAPENNTFLHFISDEKKQYVNMGTQTKERYYITVKPEKFPDFLPKWQKLCQENPIARHLNFKLHSQFETKKRDNVVIYVNKELKQEDVKAFFEKVNTECKDCLEKKEKSVVTGEAIADGITRTIEYDMDSMFKISDTFGYKKRNKTIEKKLGIKEPTQYSYNTFNAKLMFTAAEMVRKKLEKIEGQAISRSNIMEKIRVRDSVANNLFKKYYYDFMYLSGNDIMLRKNK
ncbi:MAG: hypothetical protein K6F00_11650 [Lachnospiraceae bacterium]|nr:hypothetical protein [Lachnospiraceae bacterium]